MKKTFNLTSLWLILSSLYVISVSAHSLDVLVTVTSVENATVKVTGKSSEPQKHWSFLNFYANSDNLAARRISNLKFFNEKGDEISFARQSDGEFETTTETNSFSYQLKLDYPQNPAQSAHVSWLTKKLGLLMLADLLPDYGDETIPATAAFVLPANWKIAARDHKIGENKFQIADLKKSIFLVGKFSEQHSEIGKTRINLARAGEWSFTAEESLNFAAEILAHYQKTFDSALPADNIQIFLIPFPQKFGGELWEAETRGSTVVLCAAPIAFKSRALSKLHEQLRHELFHLWIPNGLNLTGDYAWFYEGFTLYEALKTGVRLRYIRFEDFLDALSRAFDAARLNSNKNLTLLEASRLRWRGNFSELVYARGMIVAFLCDLALLEKSAGKKSLDDIFKELYRQHQNMNAPQDADKVVLDMLKNVPELRSTIENYVEKPNGIVWTQNLAAAGLQNVSQISLTRLAVANRLSGRQKKLLIALGYRAIEN